MKHFLILFLSIPCFVLVLSSSNPTLAQNKKSAAISNRVITNSSTPTIDALVVYTVAAKTWAGGVTQMQNLINQAKNNTNQSFSNSAVNASLNIVYTAEVSYSENAYSLETNLDHLSNDDGILDQIRDWRDIYHADVVLMLLHNTNDAYYWGMSTVQAYPFHTSQPEKAFAVVQVEHAVSDYSLTHELGHLLGASHAPEDTTGCGLEYLSACGYYSGSFSTIMEVDHPNLRILYWSSPNVFYQGQSTGNAVSNNAAALNQMAPIIANYRTADPNPCFSAGTLFCDVPAYYWAYTEINSLYNSITAGCDSDGDPYQDLPFCPEDWLDRAHTTVFLLRHIHENNMNYQPPGPYHGYFTDVPSSHPQALWIEELYELGLTNGSTNCSGSGFRFCPDNIVTRGEAASFLMRTEHYLGNIPDYTALPFFGIFDDVPADNPHAKAIEYMYWRGFTNGSTCGSEGFSYCLDQQVSRATMSVFMARVFGFVPVSPNDIYEPDHYWGLATWIADGETQTHSITPANDEDWLMFSLSQSSAVLLETYGGADDTRMWLYNSSLSELEYDDDDGSGNFALIDRSCGVDALPAGTYYVKVDEYDNNDIIGRYRLNFEIILTCTAAGDPFEPDGNSSQAQWVYTTEPQVRNIQPASDGDWVKFSLSNESAVTFETYGVNGDTELWLYDSNLNLLEYDDDDGIASFAWLRRGCGVSALPEGTYYVKIAEKGANNEIPNYQLDLTVDQVCNVGTQGYKLFLPFAFNIPPSNVQPDLVVTSLTITSITGNDIAYSYEITNIGTGVASLDGPTSALHDNVSAQAYLSQDTILNNAGDIPAGGSIIGAGYLYPGQSLTWDFSATTAVDPYSMNYLTLMVEQSFILDESNETNNTAAVPIP